MREEDQSNIQWGKADTEDADLREKQGGPIVHVSDMATTGCSVFDAHSIVEQQMIDSIGLSALELNAVNDKLENDDGLTAWTAIIRKPSYIIDDYPEPYHLIQIEGGNAQHAAELALIEAMRTDENEGRQPITQDDYELVVVFAGLPDPALWGWSMDMPAEDKPEFEIIKSSTIEVYTCKCGAGPHHFLCCNEKGIGVCLHRTGERMLYKCEMCGHIVEINNDSIDE